MLKIAGCPQRPALRPREQSGQPAIPVCSRQFCQRTQSTKSITMTVSAFFMPSVNLIGEGAVEQACDHAKQAGFTQGLIVTDKPLVELGYAAQLQQLLADRGVKSCIYDGVQPNPTTSNVEADLALLKENNCDFLLSLGGGSPHDCAKAIALVASNGGDIRDYEGVNQSAKPQLPLISINTTRSEEHTSELQSRPHLVCRLLLEKKNIEY